MVTCFDVCEILEMLFEASVKVFLDGGWGIDALIGRETRIHNDIDLLENNIGFFSKSKNADAMVADIREKIAKAKQELQLTIEKVRMIDARSTEDNTPKE